MGTKVFMERNGFTLQSDERDFVVPVEHRVQVKQWCQQTGVVVESPLSKDNRKIVEDYFEVDLWRVRDDEQRMWFSLRWI